MQNATSAQKAAIIGAGSLDTVFAYDASDQTTFLAKFLRQCGIRVLHTGGGGGAPLEAAKQCFFAEVHGFSPWPSYEAHVNADGDWPVDDKIIMHYIGGAEEGDFGKRDHYTLSGCDHLLVMGLGKVGAGTGRELFRALKMKSIKHIIFALSTFILPEEEERFKKLLECARMFRRRDVNVALLPLDGSPLQEWL